MIFTLPMLSDDDDAVLHKLRHLTHLGCDHEPISELLGIPADIRHGALIPTAYYLGDTFKPAPRQPLDAVLHINTW